MCRLSHIARKYLRRQWDCKDTLDEINFKRNGYVTKGKTAKFSVRDKKLFWMANHRSHQTRLCFALNKWVTLHCWKVYWFRINYTRCSIDKIYKQQREIHSKWVLRVLTEELTNIEANEQNEKSEYCFHHNQICWQSAFFYHCNPTRLLSLGSSCNWVLFNITFSILKEPIKYWLLSSTRCFHQSESLRGNYGACRFLESEQLLRIYTKLPFIDLFSESRHISGRKLTSNQVWQR